MDIRTQQKCKSFEESEEDDEGRNQSDEEEEGF